MMNLENKNDRYSLWDTFNDMFTDAFSKEMKTDIEENEDGYLLNVEIPGVSKEDINLSFEDDTLTIHVKKSNKKDDKNKNYIAKERSTLDMTRSFYLENVDENSISAKLDNGILTIGLTKLKNIPNPKKVISIE